MCGQCVSEVTILHGHLKVGLLDVSDVPRAAGRGEDVGDVVHQPLLVNEAGLLHTREEFTRAVDELQVPRPVGPTDGSQVTGLRPRLADGLGHLLGHARGDVRRRDVDAGAWGVASRVGDFTHGRTQPPTGHPWLAGDVGQHVGSRVHPLGCAQQRHAEQTRRGVTVEQPDAHRVAALDGDAELVTQRLVQVGRTRRHHPLLLGPVSLLVEDVEQWGELLHALTGTDRHAHVGHLAAQLQCAGCLAASPPLKLATHAGDRSHLVSRPRRAPVEALLVGCLGHVVVELDDVFVFVLAQRSGP